MREEEEEMRKQKEKEKEERLKHEIKKEEVAPKEEKELPPISEQINEEENKFRESSPNNLQSLRASTRSHALFQSRISNLYSM